VTGIATMMRHDDLITALRQQIPGAPPVLRYALRLLLEHNNGVWFTDRYFVALVVDDAIDASPVQLNFTELAKLLDEARRRVPWTYRHGPAASDVLWLACEIAGGRMFDLAHDSDADTAELIASLLAELFRRRTYPGAPAGPAPALLDRPDDHSPEEGSR
jgi:hypothetical protein